MGIIREIEAGINFYYYKYGFYPATIADAMAQVPLDPWGNPYKYLPSLKPDGTHNYRWDSDHLLDKNNNPLNSDFDLYSRGKDGATILTICYGGAGLDDVARIGNGFIVTLGQDYCDSN